MLSRALATTRTSIVARRLSAAALDLPPKVRIQQDQYHHVHAYTLAIKIGTKVIISSCSTFKLQFDNFINGEFTPPVDGAYFDNISPIDGNPFIQAARSNKASLL